MGNLGFSYVGLVYLLMLTIPNLLWAKRQPPGYDPSGESKLLLGFERLGQVAVTCCALFFRDFNLRPFTPWSLWLAASFALMLVYELFWLRYFKNPTLTCFYGPFLGIPLPGASLPVAAFFLLGIYGRVIWMLLAIAALGIGHIGIHAQHWRALQAQTSPPSPPPQKGEGP